MSDFLPFTRPNIGEDSIAAVATVLRSGQLASGPKVLQFEAALAEYIGGGRQLRALTSATEGLEIALCIAGVGAGDEVIVPAMSFAASANVVARLGATPVFVDVELATRNIDVALAERAVTPRTKAIMPVQCSGVPVDLDALGDLARRRGLRIVEDAAHAIGSRHRGRTIGSFGDLVVFSFHPNKNMTTIEGGAIATADPAAVALIEQHRFHGIKKNAEGEIDVLFPGAKSNLSDVAAQIGIDQLRRLDGFNRRRRDLAARYYEQLQGFDRLVLPARGDEGHSWHMFTVL
ncbi:MAG: DegT/DnrJ/EryC1/StrS family aminotransferase, partial [Solirubrobacteraceae bacterium]